MFLKVVHLVASIAGVNAFINFSVFANYDRDVNTFQRAELVGFVRICTPYFFLCFCY